MNKVILVGNVSTKGELKPAGKTQVINLGFATNERYKDAAGNQKQHADFHNLAFFGKLAETAAKHVNVGATLTIEGHISYSNYEKEGQKHTVASIVVEKMEFHGKKAASGSAPPAPANQRQQEKPKGKLKEGDSCPKCSTGKIVKKSGQNGGFLACDGYPNCRHIVK